MMTGFPAKVNTSYSLADGYGYVASFLLMGCEQVLYVIARSPFKGHPLVTRFSLHNWEVASISQVL